MNDFEMQIAEKRKEIEKLTRDIEKIERCQELSNDVIQEMNSINGYEMDIDTEHIVNSIEILSRFKGFNSDVAKKITAFLVEYCFFDLYYTNGTILVPMYRVMDALDMMKQNKIGYCEQ